MTSPGVDVEAGPALLQAHLLGRVDFDEALRLQRRLAYQVSGGAGPALVLCEHAPLVTVGRHGSPGDIHLGPEELSSRRCRVRWVARGGGTILHLPGQMALYPVLPLGRLGLDVSTYLARLHQVVIDLLDDFGIAGEVCPG